MIDLRFVKRLELMYDENNCSVYKEIRVLQMRRALSATFVDVERGNITFDNTTWGAWEDVPYVDTFY
jgi:hypothetical protein